jgi:CopG family nickel-responsive transcriptional regulator
LGPVTIISISANEKMLADLDRIQKDLGFSGRSEAVRAAIRMLLSESADKETLTGRVRGVLLVIHDHEAEDFITSIKHKFLDIIYTQLHNRFKEGKCLELFILDGEADRIRQLKKTLQKNEQIEHVKLTVA